MKKVLVVDDEYLNQKLIRAILKDKYECDTVSNAREAIERYRDRLTLCAPYDLVLLDIAMPDRDGVETLRDIRALEEKRGVMMGDGVPVIMITAYREYTMPCFTSGCDDYLLKPLNPKDLIDRMEKILLSR